MTGTSKQVALCLLYMHQLRLQKWQHHHSHLVCQDLIDFPSEILEANDYQFFERFVENKRKKATSNVFMPLYHIMQTFFLNYKLEMQ